MPTSKKQVLSIIGTGIFGVVANYSALPPASAHTNESWMVLNEQGTSWLPGPLGGTYYNRGEYFSDGTNWITVNVPYNASQSTVNTGSNDNQFVTPFTLKNSTQWATKEDYITPSFTNAYFRGDKTFQPLDTSVVPDSTNRRYVTDTQQTNISNLSGVNTGDETTASIKTKLGIASASQDGYLLQADWNTFNNKQPAGNYITALTGDVTAIGPGSAGATLASVIVAATKGGVDKSLTIQYDAKGRLLVVTENAIQITEAQVTGLVSDLAGKQPTGNYITALTGDGAASGPGSSAFTLTSIIAGATKGAADKSLTLTYDAKGRITAAVENTIQITEAQVTGLVSDLAAKEPTIAPGTTAQYWRGDKSWQTLTSAVVTELTNLYFTTARVLATALAGLNTSLTGTITSADTVLSAFGKIQNAITTNTANIATNTANIASNLALILLKEFALNITVVKAADYSPAANEYVPFDASAATRIATLPNAPVDGTLIGIKVVAISGAFVVTINTQGTDVINVAGGVVTANLTVLNQSVVYKYKASVGIWYAIHSTVTKSYVDSQDALKANLAGAAFTGAVTATNLSGTNTGDETAARIAVINHGASSKSNLVDADETTGQDSAASFGLIRTTWLQVWTNYIKVKADALYQTLAAKDATGGYAGLTGFAINFYNTLGTFKSQLVNASTAIRTYTFPDRNINVSGLDDILMPISVGFSIALSPADSSTYFFGSLIAIAPTTAAGNSRRIRIPTGMKGEIIGFAFAFNTAVTATSEANTFSLFNITQGTSVVMSSTLVINGQNTYDITGFAPLAFLPSDVMEIRWVTPAWVTNPTSVQISGNLLARRTL